MKTRNALIKVKRKNKKGISLLGIVKMSLGKSNKGPKMISTWKRVKRQKTTLVVTGQQNCRVDTLNVKY